MSLALIKKYPLDNGGKKPVIQIMSKLTDKERTLLAEFFVLDGLLMKDDKHHILTLCRSIYEHDYWVQCHCIPAFEKPVFRFNRAISGKLYLHHITSRASHAEHCVFKEREWMTSDTPGKPEKPYLKKTTPLNLISKKSFDLLAKNDKATAKKNSMAHVTRRSSLCRALYRLLDDGGLNVINPEKTQPPFKALERAALNIEIQPQKKLLDYLYTSPAMLFKAAYALRDDKTTWPRDIPKHALMLVKARNFNEQTIEAILPNGNSQIINISHHIRPLSGRLGVRSEPYMALILVTDSVEKPNFYEPVKAFIVPCYSEKTFIPVDSHYEREILRGLFALQFEYARQGRFFEIIKPLFDIPVYQGTPDEAFVLPDFIVKTSQKNLVIEVNGSHENDYLQRKTRMHQSMGVLGKVLSIDAYGAEKEDRFKQSIHQFLTQLKHHLN